MDILNKNWLTEGLIDFEYKKYILLAYLKSVKSNFDAQRLYPFLSDLVFHYQNLVSIREHKKLIYDHFPQVITKADFEKLQISYKKIVEDDNLMKEIEDILSFSIPRLKNVLEQGAERYEYLEKNVEIQPIGISPLYAVEGYMLINQDHSHELDIFRYHLTIFENANETYRAVNTEFIEKEKKSIGRTLEHLKLDLVKRYKELPNPATYVIIAKIPIPFQHTLLPIAKRILVKYISAHAA